MSDLTPTSGHDDKGFSEEKCLRCGWVMGQPPLNCNNDDTPHRFPSQQSLEEQLEAVEQDLGAHRLMLKDERRWRAGAEADLAACKKEREMLLRQVTAFTGNA